MVVAFKTAEISMREDMRSDRHPPDELVADDLPGPGFDYVDATHIEALVSCLKYHNFRPRRPVKEHGQAHSDNWRNSGERRLRWPRRVMKKDWCI